MKTIVLKENLDIPFSSEFKWGQNAKFTIKAEYFEDLEQGDKKGFALALTAQNGSVFPHSPIFCNFRQIDGKVHLNSCVDSIWEKEAEAVEHCYKAGDEVLITITCKDNHFLVSCNGKMKQFMYRGQPKKINSVFVEGSLNILEATLTYDVDGAAKK